MICESFITRDGTRGVMCLSGRRRERPCSVCQQRPSTLECDGPNPRRTSGTCDAPLCEECTTRDPNVVAAGPFLDTHDLCPACSKRAAAPSQRQLPLEVG